MFGPKFDRLKTILNREDGALVLQADPTALAPERLMVFEVRGSINNFAKALNRVEGLSLVDEEELPDEVEGHNPYLYMVVPDFEALRKVESLWRRWSRGEDLGRGYAPWRDLFSLLRDIRLWSARDRLQPFDQEILNEEIDGRVDSDLITLEIELVYSPQNDLADKYQESLTTAIIRCGGSVITFSRIVDIHYHAVLVRLPVSEVRNILSLAATSIAGHSAVMHICPQSLSTKIGPANELDANVPSRRPALPAKEPIIALLDGVPVQQHPDLMGRLTVDDQFNLEPTALVADREHGTAMASLITRGDLNTSNPPLNRKVHVVPLLGAKDEFPPDRLIIDLVYSAVSRMLDGETATAKDILVINLSLGNKRRIFDGRMSAWARLIDRLSSKYGLLFLVSAGNHGDKLITVPDVPDWTAFGNADAVTRAGKVLEGIKDSMRDRRLLSPSESINALTIGAVNVDNVSAQDRRTTNIDPYVDLVIANPSSALGPGFAQSVKPDLLFPGGKEHLSMRSSGGGGGVSAAPAPPARAHGLKVAWPPSGSNEHQRGYSGCTSGATALASRTCHLIHDALEATYGRSFLGLSKKHRAVLLKALLAHTASWPDATAKFIKGIMGPADGAQHVQQKDNIRRFLGYGIADPDLAISCASDRATFWAVGELLPDQGLEVEMPVPSCISAQSLPHYIQSTLAWTTPVAAGRKAYRSVRLTLQEPDGLSDLGVSAARLQPDQNQSRKGTVFSRSWRGDRPPVVGEDQILKFWVQREPERNGREEEAVTFGLALTLAMPGVQQIYDEVRTRLIVPTRLTA